MESPAFCLLGPRRGPHPTRTSCIIDDHCPECTVLISLCGLMKHLSLEQIRQASRLGLLPWSIAGVI